jgi:hypothetical protein
MVWTKNQELKLFTTFGNPAVQMTKNFSRNFKAKFGNLEQNTINRIIGF